MSQEALTRLTSGSILLSGLMLLCGWLVIRRRRDAVQRHRRLMLGATALAAVFLVAYVYRWSLYGSKPFAGTGLWRGAYLSILDHFLKDTSPSVSATNASSRSSNSKSTPAQQEE